MPQLSRRHFLMTGSAAALSLPTLAACAGGLTTNGLARDLATLDGIATADLIARGEVSAVEVTAAAIARARAVNPAINAIVNDRFDKALMAAATPGTGRFAGVPTFIKDLSNLPGEPTEFGSRGFKGYVAQGGTPVVEAFVATGVIALGKSSTPEAGLMATTEPLSSGATRNPWNTDHSTGGSSGGAAALTAARVVPFAMASDGGGSIRIPASCCGVFGLKPSRGRTRPNHSGEAPPLDISVVLANSISVRDSAAMLAEVEATSGPYAPIGYVTGPSARRLSIGLAIDAPTGVPLHPEVRAAIEDVARLCESLGHTVKPVALPLDGRAFAEAFMLYWSAGAAQFAQEAADFSGKPISPDIVEPWTLALAGHYEANKDKLEQAVAHLKSTEPQYEAAFADLGIDVLLTPTLSTPPIRIGEHAPTTDFETLRARIEAYAAYTPVQNVTGAAAMSVPLSWTAGGLPVGSHFAGRKGDDGLLLALAYELELARPWAGRLPPIHG